MIEWSENIVNNMDVSNESLAVMNENDHEQEDCDDNLICLSDSISHHSQKYLKKEGKFSTILSQSMIKDVYKLECTPQVMNVKNVKSHCNKEKMKMQYLQVDHQKVYYFIVQYHIQFFGG